MKTTRKVLLASGTALGAAFAAAPVLAQQVGTIGNPPAPMVVVGGSNGQNHCLDGSPSATGGYIEEHANSDGVHGDSLTPVPPGPDYTDSTICQSYSSTITYTDPSITFFVPNGSVGNTGLTDPLLINDYGNASATGNVSVETTTHYNVTDTGNAPVNLGVTQTSAPYGNSIVGNYSYTTTAGTVQDALWDSSTTVSGNGTTGTGTQSDYLVTPEQHRFSETTGTSSFDPVSGNVYYTPTNGQVTNLDIDGLSFTTVDTVNGNETITYDADGITNGNSYVHVNPTDVVIHGGTSSTTVTVNDAGVDIANTSAGGGNIHFTTVNGGADFSVNNDGSLSSASANYGGAVAVNDDFQVTGNTQLDGTLNVTGFTTTNGIDNTGQIETDTLQVNGAANVDGFLTTHGQDNTGALTTDTLQVDGTANISGLLTTNGQDNTGNLETDTLTVNGVSTLLGLTNSNGIDNTGQIETDTLLVNGASTMNGPVTINNNLGVTGNYSSTNGNIVLTNGNVSAVNGNFTQVNATTGNITTVNSTTVNSSTVNATTGVNTPKIYNGTQYSGAGVEVADDLTVNGNMVVFGGGTNSLFGSTNNLVATTNNISSNAPGGTVNLNATSPGGSINLNSPNTNISGILTVGGVVNANGGVNTGATGNVVVGDGIAAITSAGEVTRAGINQAAIATGVTINAVTQRISGVANGTVSATSSEAVTGAQLFATNTRVTNLETGLANLTTVVNNNFATLTDRANKAYQGVAMNFALNAAPLSLDNGEGGISGGVGYFQGEWAGAVKAQYVTDSGIGVGINVGFSEDAVGGGVGASIKF